MVTIRGYLRDFGGYRCICLYKTNISTCFISHVIISSIDGGRYVRKNL